MTFKTNVALAALTAALLIFGSFPRRAIDSTQHIEIPTPEPVAITTPAVKDPEISEVQEKWIHALEWCESRGNPSAINPKDLDGTPSLGAFQFKETTFAAFSAAYGLPEKDIMDRSAQYSIVVRMLFDRSVDWSRQFPACVRLLGQPPR